MSARKESRRSVFLLAAEKQVAYMDGSREACFPFSCYNLGLAINEANADRQCRPELKFYAELYEKDSDGPLYWWKSLPNGDFDHESRIFALLFAAEILRR